MDLNKIKEYAKGYEKDMTAFLRAIVKNTGESCDEKAHVETIAAEMKKVGFDEFFTQFVRCKNVVRKF